MTPLAQIPLRRGVPCVALSIPACEHTPQRNLPLPSRHAGPSRVQHDNMHIILICDCPESKSRAYWSRVRRISRVLCDQRSSRCAIRVPEHGRSDLPTRCSKSMRVEVSHTGTYLSFTRSTQDAMPGDGGGG